MTITVPVIRYHGAKFRLAPWVLQHFPPHTCHVESFGYAAGVLMSGKRDELFSIRQLVVPSESIR